MIESVEVVIRQPGQPDRTVRLKPGSTRLGRADDNEMVLPDVGVSRKHALLQLDDDELVIEDLGSGNGTYFNGGRIQSQVLQDGDEVVIDPFVLLFRVQGAAPAPRRSAAQAPARLEVVVGTGVAGSTYPLTKGHPLTIGRSEERELVIPDPAASRHHATVAYEERAWVLRDEGSANGVFVNESRVRRAQLRDDDLIRIGNTELRFVLSPSTMGDTTTQQVVPGGVWNPAAGRSQTVPSAAAAATPAPLPELAATRQRGGRGTVLAAVLGGVVAFLVIAAIISVLLLGVVLYFTGAFATGVDHPPPAWSIAHTADLPDGAPARFELGVQRLQSGKPGAALEAFHGALVLDPGDPAAERFAHAAAELMVMESLTHAFTASEQQRLERAAERDALLARLEQRGRTARDARGELAERFADDPAVAKRLDLPPSEAVAARGAAFDRARKAKAPSAAYAGWSEALDLAVSAEQRDEAQAGLDDAGRDLAAQTHGNWIAALVSEQEGDAVAAADHLSEVERAWPGGPATILHPRE